MPSINVSEINFFKMQGSGNDFIVIDNNKLRLSPQEMPNLAQKLCPRGFAVGADGMIFLEDSPDADLDFVWHFFNSDGSRAEMCGNGSRCASLLAFKIGLAGKNHVFGTDAGPVKAGILDSGLVKVQLTPARDMRQHIVVDYQGQSYNVFFVNTGVPHAVIIFDDVSQVDVPAFGRFIRMHEEFAPAGTNVNFIEITSNNSIKLRTYERGVEAETHACGTGAAAAAAIANVQKLVESSVEVTTTGGETLIIDLEGEDIFLSGKAQIVYKGQVDTDFLRI
ncbi:diaminopimelate epimerase [Desulfonatronovibrio magnus]|uniref:diaminopimelate epimerase n=1 Tax=Desulfonatronovibrio magnus TaxID=698827 RepID=UPI0005EB4DE1|nr:diaminopimelate epimerase [Desulfonatronovibrio magnus]